MSEQFRQVSVCMFKRVPTPSKADGWERGIALLEAGDPIAILDNKGKLVGQPYTYFLAPTDGSFMIDLGMGKRYNE